MSSSPAHPSIGRLVGLPAWTTMTQAPLKGVSLAREAGVVLIWDQSDQVCLLDQYGTRLVETRAPGPIVDATISDDGSLAAILVEEPRLWILGRDLRPRADRGMPGRPRALATDPHGRYLAVASDFNLLYILNRYGRRTGEVELRQPLTSLQFIPDRPGVIGIGTYGTLVAIGLEFPGGAGDRLEGWIAWDHQLTGGVGRLACSGDGAMILLSCYTHGVQKYDRDGRHEGAYHLPGGAIHAVPDFGARWIAAATMDGELMLLNRAGNIRWRERLARPPLTLHIDAIGRYLIYGQETGEVTRIDVMPAEKAAEQRARQESETSSAPPSLPGVPGASARPVSASPSVPAASRSSGIREPAWTVPVARTDLEAETAVLAVIDRPPRIALLAGKNRVQVFDYQGNLVLAGREMPGVGRILRVGGGDGWLAAATDRNVMLVDLEQGEVHAVERSLYEVTQVEPWPSGLGAILVQERDRLGRLALPDRWVWNHAWPEPIESVAAHPSGYLAVSTESGSLQILDPAGEPIHRQGSADGSTLMVMAAPGGDATGIDPQAVAWITASRTNQQLSGLALRGDLQWRLDLPWEPWQLLQVGSGGVVTAPDGRAIAFDRHGACNTEAHARPVEGMTSPVFGTDPDGRVLRVLRREKNLLVETLDGRIYWRAILRRGRGPIALGSGGLALLDERDLAWFPHRPDEDDSQEAIPIV